MKLDNMTVSAVNRQVIGISPCYRKQRLRERLLQGLIA